jgi:SAM-dependent methyltransferase
MSSRRQPRSRFYDGSVYGRFVDPLLDGVHAFVVSHLPAGQRVLDACCGTGALSLRLARSGKEVVGVDLSPRNIEHAERQRLAATLDNVRFEIGDVAYLERWADREFDVATLVLALHEMPADCRVPVLKEVARVAGRVLVLDYAVPMPLNLAGLRNRAIELTAGREHYLAFRNFSRHGGLDALVRAAGLHVGSARPLDSGALTVQELFAGDPTPSESSTS